MARPLKKIDTEQLEKLASMHCTVPEMAAFFSVSRDTLERRYAAIIAKGRETGKTRLRKAQWEAALKGNIVMMIFLGKQYLAQSDKLEQTIADGDLEAKKAKLQELVSEFKAMIEDRRPECLPNSISMPPSPSSHH